MIRKLVVSILIAAVFSASGPVPAALAEGSAYQATESQYNQVAVDADMPDSQRLERDRVIEGLALHPLYRGPFGCEFLRLRCLDLEEECDKTRERWIQRWREYYGTEPQSHPPAPGSICDRAALCFVDYFELCSRD